MRQIKFRGLRTDGKGFAFGLLRKQRQRDTSQSGNGVAYTGDWEYWIDSHEGEQGSWLVIPESLGQFTGLHDKNGVEIYEGDVLKRSISFAVEEGNQPSIYYDKVVYSGGGFKTIRIDDERRGYSYLENYVGHSIEVIGSIHTNEKGQEG